MVKVMASSIAPPLPSSRHPGTERWSNHTRKPTVYSNLTITKEKATNSEKYCELFEQEDECNGDQDCSWCNILDICVGRNKEDFKRCTGTKRNEEINAPSMHFYIFSCSLDTSAQLNAVVALSS